MENIRAGIKIQIIHITLIASTLQKQKESLKNKVI